MIEVFLLILSVVLLSGAILGAFISGVWFGGRKPQEKPLDAELLLSDFLEQEGGTHSGEYAMEYFYNGLCWIWQ